MTIEILELEKHTLTTIKTLEALQEKQENKLSELKYEHKILIHDVELEKDIDRTESDLSRTRQSIEEFQSRLNNLRLI